MKSVWEAFLNTRSEEDFELLFKEAEPLVYTICRRYLRDSEEAGEAFQLAWIRLLDEAERGVLPEGEPKAVIGRLAAREADAYLKRKLRRSQKEWPVDEWFSISDQSASPKDISAQRELRARLEALLYQLPDKLRLPAMLHYLDGMTQQEVADTLGIPRPTVATRLRSALKKLRPMARRAGLVEGLEVLVGGSIAGALLRNPAQASALDVYTAWKAGNTVLPVLQIGQFVTTSLIIKSALGIVSLAVLAKLAIISIQIANQPYGASPETEVVTAQGSGLQEDSETSAMNQDAPGSTDAANPSDGETTTPYGVQPSSPATISTTATWAGTDQPVVDANVQLIVDSTATAQTVTDPQGSFSFSIPDHWKPASIRFAHPDLIGNTLDLSIVQDQDRVIELDKKPSIIGTVMRVDTGELVPSATVQIAGADLEVETDDFGQFQINRIDPGDYTISAKSGSMMTTSDPSGLATLNLEPNDTVTSLTLRLIPPGTVSVLVLDKTSGEPIPNAEIHRLGVPSVYTNKSGWALLDDMTPGDYRLEVLADAYAQEEKALVLGEDRDALMVFDLVPGGSVYGIVCDIEGNPIEGVRVGGFFRGPTCFGDWARTDANGYYEAHHFEKGRVIDQLSFSKSGYERVWLSEQVMITDDTDRLEYNITLQPGTDVVGYVLDDTGMAIEGALVDCGKQFHTPDPMTRTDASGYFSLSGTDGSHPYLLVRAEGYAAQRIDFDLKNASDLRITMKPEHWIGGTVEDTDGAPIADAMIYIRAFRVHTIVDVITDEEGSFHIDGLPEDIEFWVGKLGYTEEELNHPELNRGDYRITLLPEGIIHGRVVDADSGDPVQHLNVRLGFPSNRLPGDRRSSISTALIDYGLDFDNPDGSFEIPRLNSGSALAITVSAEGYLPKVINRVEVMPATDAEEQLIKLEEAGGEGIEGVVVDSTGAVVSGAQVRLLAYRKKTPGQLYTFRWRNVANYKRDCISYQDVYTDDSGHFRLEPFATSGPIQLLVTKDGYGRKKEKLDQWPEGNMRVTLEKGAQLHVRIKSGAFASGSVLQFDRLYENLLWQKLDDSETEYVIKDIPSGQFTLSVSEPSTDVWKLLAREEVELSAGEIKRVNLGFEEKHTISGILRYDGQPVSGYRVVLCRPQGNFARLVESTVTDSQGYYTLEATDGKWLVCPIGATNASMTARHSATQQVTISGEDIQQDFDLVYTGAIKGRLLNLPDQYREEVNHIMVCVQFAPGSFSNFAWIETARDGTFSISGLKEGTYCLMSPNNTGLTRPIAENIEVPADGTDINLGDLRIPD